VVTSFIQQRFIRKSSTIPWDYNYILSDVDGYLVRATFHYIHFEGFVPALHFKGWILIFTNVNEFNLLQPTLEKIKMSNKSMQPKVILAYHGSHDQLYKMAKEFAKQNACCVLNMIDDSAKLQLLVGMIRMVYRGDHERSDNE